MPPPAEEQPPFLNFAPLKNASDTLKKSADHYASAVSRLKGESAQDWSDRITAINPRLIQIQRAFLTEKGLPERPWFKHQVYAPGAYTGYGAKPIAAVREYMDQKKWKEAEEQVPSVAKVVGDAAEAIDRAATEIEKSLPAKTAKP